MDSGFARSSKILTCSFSCHTRSDISGNKVAEIEKHPAGNYYIESHQDVITRELPPLIEMPVSARLFKLFIAVCH
jgi:hypothetical protein